MSCDLRKIIFNVQNDNRESGKGKKGNRTEGKNEGSEILLERARVYCGIGDKGERVE